MAAIDQAIRIAALPLAHAMCGVLNRLVREPNL